MFEFLASFIFESSRGTAWEAWVSPLRVFRYITFRSVCAAVTAMMLSLWLGPAFIRWLQRLKFGQDYEDRAQEQGDLKGASKKGTPTMGGLMIVLVLDVTALLWTRWTPLVLLTLLAVVILCGLGFYDDYHKIMGQSADKGASEGAKLAVQFAFAVFAAIYLWQWAPTTTVISDVMVPFLKEPVLTGAVGTVFGLGLAAFTIVGSSNAVNLTDGLDGLATGLVTIVAAVFVVLTYVAGHYRFAGYLNVPYVPQAGELTVFCAAMVGACLGFLWFNCHPARVFMGDTGSLALGGILGIIAVLIHQPLVLAIAGGVFVMEAGSVLIQRGWFKYTRRKFGEGRRVFLMTPIHHHFQKLGWHETQIVTRFYILGLLFAAMALGTLKTR